MSIRVVRLIAGCLLCLTITLAAQTPQPMTIEGAIVDALTGKPIPGVNVYPPQQPWPKDAPPPQPNSPPRRPLIRTANDGTFVIDNIPAQVDYPVVTFRKSGYLDLQVFYKFLPGERAHIAVRLKPTATLTGRVFDKTGQPAVDITVTVYRRGRDPVFTPTATAFTDDRGEFRLLDLLPETYLVGFASKPMSRLPANAPIAMQFFTRQDTPTAIRELYPGANDVASAETIEIKGGEELRLKDVTLGSVKMGEVHVRLVNAGNDRFKDVDLIVTGFGQNGRTNRAESPSRVHLESGTPYEKVFRPNGPGVFSARANWTEPDGTNASTVVPFEFSGRDIYVEVAAVKPSGRLNIRAWMDAADGTSRPLAGVDFQICRKDLPCIYNDFTIAPEIGFTKALSGPASGADGMVHLDGIPEGRFELHDVHLRGSGNSVYLVSAVQENHDVLTEGVVVSKAESTIEVHIKPATSRVAGKVVDRQGRNVQEGIVVLLPEPPLDGVTFLLQRTSNIDQTGSYEISGIRPGAYRVFALSDAGVDIYDAQLMAKFRGRGTAVTIEENGHVALNLPALDEP